MPGEELKEQRGRLTLGLVGLCSEPRCQVDQILGHVVEPPGRHGCHRRLWSILERPMNKRRAKAELLGGLQVTLVRRDHHHLLRPQVEELGYQPIHLWVRLVVPDQLGRKDAVPWEPGVLGHVGEQRDVAVREGSHHKASAEALERRRSPARAAGDAKRD